MFEDLKDKLRAYIAEYKKQHKLGFANCTDSEITAIRVERDMALSLLIKLQQIELQFEDKEIELREIAAQERMRADFCN